HFKSGAPIALFLTILKEILYRDMQTKIMTLLFDLLRLSLLLASGSMFTQAFADTLKTDQLRQMTEEFVRSELLPLAEKQHRYDFLIGNIPPKLKFSDCDSEIVFSIRRRIYQSPNNTIELKCSSPSWQLFVPLTIDIYGDVVVAATSIPKNTLIQPRHLELKEQQLNVTRYAHYDEIDLVTGMLSKRTIKQGSAITPSRLQAPNLISRGDQVIISAKSNIIAIQMKGEALNSGALGEQISVKNLSSDRIIRAQVVERGRVAVLM
ncbi:hypothetical protein A3737_26150, partial [Oleiphilus sp. HI0065]